MEEWAKVRWSEAGQIIDILKWKESDSARASAPVAYFKSLVDRDKLDEAVSFLAQALPRHEVVTWAARTVRDLAPPETEPAEQNALKAALLWVQNPAEARRRAAFDAAQAADSCSAECMAAMAAYYSGGSIAPPDCEPLPAPRHAAGLFAGAAIRIAAGRSKDRKAALRTALKAGVEFTRADEREAAQ
ncbi:MAG TPA: hypothetical protein VFW28_10175 [Micropepsaceae bacterium]|nr:hypothetical protein [Micropepsaceae bacterium]